MHLAEAYRSLARPSSALEPSHPLAGIFADLISYAPLNSVSVWSQSLYTASQALFRPPPFPKESTSLGAYFKWTCWDSDPGPLPCKGSALPAELQALNPAQLDNR